MKKIFAILLITALLMTLTACAEEAPVITAEPTPTAVPSPTEIPVEPEEGIVETSLMDVAYPEDWYYNEDTSYIDHETAILLFEHMGVDGSLHHVYISAIYGNAEHYRSQLNTLGVDAFDMVTNGTGTFADVAGMSLRVVEGLDYYGMPTINYIGRDAAKGLSLFVEVSAMGTLDPVPVEELLSGVVVHVEDGGFSDPPWFWEGEAYNFTETAPVSVGDYTINATQLKLDVPLESFDNFSNRIALSGDSLWISAHSTLYEYTMGDTGLSYISEMVSPNGNAVTSLASDTMGNLYVADYTWALNRLSPTGEMFTYEGIVDHIDMHPDGTWGIEYFSGSNVLKFSLDGDNVIEETLIEVGDFTIWNAHISQNHIMLFGGYYEAEHQLVKVYGHDGTHKLDLSIDEAMVLSDVVETTNGFVGLGNLDDKLYLWDHSGSYLGFATISDLLGANYASLTSAAVTPDGSLLVSFVQDRPDDSGDEVIIANITGF